MAWKLKANIRGPQGYSVQSADVGGDDHLRVILSNGTVLDAGNVRGAQGLPGVNAVDNDTAVAGYISTPGNSATKTALSTTIATSRIAPNMTVYPGVTVPYNVLFQDGLTMYGHNIITGRDFLKSVDGGQTWTTRGDLGFTPLSVVKVVGTNTLIAIQLTDRELTGQNPQVKRSIDDGATWALVTTLTHPGLGHQGIISPAAGVILIGEYGNTGNTVYRIMRSADDGLTWAAVLSSPGTDSMSDPGHIHSITQDPETGTLVAFMDRAEPEVYKSDDLGVTWLKIGNVTEGYHPNFVAPMYFEDYIAWGVDNDNHGKIFRLPRADFYAGNWADPELVAQVNRIEFYDTFPIRPGVWVVSGATESIGGDPFSSGSFMMEMFIVSDNGGVVTGGVAHAAASTFPKDLSGTRASLPGYPAANPDQRGLSWARFRIDSGGTASAPFTVGIGPAMPQLQGAFEGPVVPFGGKYRVRDAAGVARSILDVSQTGAVRLMNEQAPGNEVRINPDGTVVLTVGNISVTQFTASGPDLRGTALTLDGSKNAASFLQGTVPPEGVVTAGPGSIYIHYGGRRHAQIYVRTELGGASNTGWAPVGSPASTDSNTFNSAASWVNTIGKVVGKQAWNTTTKKPVFPVGAAATDIWVFADGTTAHTPA